MIERGIGEYNWVNNFVGLHYEAGGRTRLGIDCWGLVCMVYEEQLDILLPDWMSDDEIDWNKDRGEWTPISEPKDFCFVRSKRASSLADHWGIFIAGGVLSAAVPTSNFVPYDRYVERHPEAELGIFALGEGTLS